MHREVRWRREEIRTTFGSHRLSSVSENITRASFINTANNKDNAAVQEIKLIPDSNTSYVTLADPQLITEFILSPIRSCK